MFLLGHACWSYLFSKSSAPGLRVNMPAYLALLAGVLPDFDIYFQPLGLTHHTYTHSLLVIIPTVVVLTYFLGRLGLAFSIGIMSHLVGDYLVGTIPLLYPVYPDWTVGLNLGIPSLADTLLEMGAFGLVMLYALQNGDYRLLLKPSRESLLLAIPLVAIDTLTILFAGDKNIPLVAFALLRKTLTIISIGHILLSALLALGVLQGLLWYYHSKPRRGASVDGGSGSNQGRELVSYPRCVIFVQGYESPCEPLKTINELGHHSKYTSSDGSFPDTRYLPLWAQFALIELIPRFCGIGARILPYSR